MINRAAYLQRIGFDEPLHLTNDVLNSLHRKHIYQVPFENLDVYYKRVFDLKVEKIYQKVVVERRGGFCYELNLLFNELLQELGFSSRIISARIFNEQGVPGPEFDHMCVCVDVQKEYLVDVGYGDLFVTPLEIKEGVQYDGRNHFKIEQPDHDNYLLSMSSDGVVYENRYTFSLSVVQQNSFELPCLDKQTNPSSYFVQNVVCTKPTETGRVTIFNDKLIERRGALRIITPIEGDEDLREMLKDKFDVVIRNGAAASPA